MSKESGFTLLEVVIAILLMSLLVLGMGVLTFASRQMRLNAEVKAIATNYAENKLEQIRNMGFNAVTSENFSPIDISNDLGLQFQCGVNVTEHLISSGTTGTTLNSFFQTPGSGVSPEVKKVAVTVRWGTGEFQSVTLETIITP